ncbi:MAG TPA: trehalase family glycosidase [Silvibacterium sp.]|nr:trehalase family glycosidase [Silvibacterium sp.]
MRRAARTCVFPLLAAILLSGVVLAQSAAPATSQNTKILNYIDTAWNTLSRSMSDCKSVVDTKVSTASVLYLPAGMATPPSVLKMERQCKVHVKHLPRAITHMGDVRVSELPQEGLLYLPSKYVVPGGRFNEMYGWDSYFILLGLVQDHRADLARGMVENFFFEIENYGAVLNANRTYYLTRSQPPFLSSMIRELYEHPEGKPLSKEWLARAYGYADRDYSLWITVPHLAGDTGLARYDDIGSGPVPEMSDNDTYYSDVIRWLLAHPEVHTTYLVDGAANPTPAQAAALAKISCNVTTSHLCANAHVGDHRLSSGFYHGDRAMRESGFDPSFRYGPFSGSTQDYADVGLNSLLYKYALDMAHFATLLGRPSDAEKWKQRAAARRAAINKYFWNPTAGLFYDYNFVTHQRSTYNYITTFYPLWAGLATPQQAAAVDHHLSIFNHEGGLAMSDFDSGTQWDLPFGWAPTNWLATKGLVQYGFATDADRVSREFTRSILQNFLHDGTIREKYNVVDGSANVKVAEGYTQNVVGFGWTNAVYLKMTDVLAHAPQAAAPSISSYGSSSNPAETTSAR